MESLVIMSQKCHKKTEITAVSSTSGPSSDIFNSTNEISVSKQNSHKLEVGSNDETVKEDVYDYGDFAEDNKIENIQTEIESLLMKDDCSEDSLTMDFATFKHLSNNLNEKMVREGLSDRYLSRMRFVNGQLFFQKFPSIQHEIIHRRISHLIEKFNVDEKPLVSLGSTRIQYDSDSGGIRTVASLAPDTILINIFANSLVDGTGVILPTIVIEAQLDEKWESMHQLSQVYLSNPATVVVINVFALRDKEKPCKNKKMEGGMVDELYYIEYRRGDKVGADGTITPYVIRSFGSCTKPSTKQALCQHLNVTEDSLNIGMPDGCNESGLEEFVMHIPGELLWSTVPPHVKPTAHPTFQKDVAIDLYKVRQALQVLSCGL